jgi:chromosome segregation ATPase
MNEPKTPQADTNDTAALTAPLSQALGALADRAQAGHGEAAIQFQAAREALAALEAAAAAQEDLIADTLRELRSQEVKLAERIQARLAETAGASQKVTALERALEEGREEVEKAQAKAVEQGQKASEAQQAAEAAQKRCGDLQKQLEEHTAALEEAQTTIESLRTAVEAKEEEDISAAEQIQTLESELQTRAAALEEAQTTIDSLRTAVDAKEEEDISAAEQIQTLETELQARTAALEEAQTTIEALRTAVDAKEEEDISGAERIRTLEEQVASLTGALGRSEAVNEELQELLDRARTDLEAAPAADSPDEAASEALQAELEGLRTEVKTLQLELEESRSALSEADALREELGQSRQQIATLESRLEDEMARGKESALAGQLADALRAREEVEERLAALERDMEATANAEGPPLERVKSSMRVPDLSAAAEIVEDLELGVAAPAATRGVLDVPGADQDGRKRHIGQILLDAGSITRAQLDECLDIQRSSPNRHLGEVLIDQGFVSDDVVAQAISRQSGIEYVRIGSGDIDPDALGLLGRKLAALHSCIPLRADGDTLTLAMENPLDLIAIEDVERATQKSVVPVASPRGEILVAIQDYYGGD